VTETEFWTDLEHRVSRELRGLSDNRLRFLWCDGFVADDHQPDAAIIAGRAWISEDDGKTFKTYRFQLLLNAPALAAEIDWAALVPGEEAHDWLRVDREEKRIEVRIPPSP
jgi:hypothetical protein